MPSDDPMAQAAMSKAAAVAQLADQEYQEMLLQREANDALAKMMSSLKQKKDLSSTQRLPDVVKALQTVGERLKEVIVIALQAVDFWRGLEAFCQRLAEPDMISTLKDAATLSREEKKEFYADEVFLYNWYFLCCQWSAMY